MMKTIEMLLDSDYLNDTGLIGKISELHGLTVQECNKSKNIPKLMSGAGVFTGMLGFNQKDLARKCTKTLLFLLYHSFPKVRKHTADKLYTSLLAMEDTSIVFDSEEACEAAQEVLSETDWSAPLKTIAGEAKVKMYEHFGHEVKTKASTEEK